MTNEKKRRTKRQKLVVMETFSMSVCVCYFLISYLVVSCFYQQQQKSCLCMKAMDKSGRGVKWLGQYFDCSLHKLDLLMFSCCVTAFLLSFSCTYTCVYQELWKLWENIVNAVKNVCAFEYFNIKFLFSYERVLKMMIFRSERGQTWEIK